MVDELAYAQFAHMQNQELLLIGFIVRGGNCVFAAGCRSHGFRAAAVGAASCRDFLTWHSYFSGHELAEQ